MRHANHWCDVQAAAAVEVLWRAHYIVTRQRIDAAVDHSASEAAQRADDAPSLLLGVVTTAQVRTSQDLSVRLL